MVDTDLLGSMYAATKFGISVFSVSLPQEVAGRGVRVILIEPGFVATELATHITDPVMRAAATELHNRCERWTPRASPTQSSTP